MRIRYGVSLLLALMLVGSIAGCSGDEAGTASPDEQGGDSAVTAETPIEGGTEPEVAVEGDAAGADAPTDAGYEFEGEWDVPVEMWVGTWQIDEADTVFPTVTLRADGTADLTRGGDGETRPGTWTLSGGQMTLEDSMGNIITNQVFFVAEGQWEMMFEGVYSKVEK